MNSFKHNTYRFFLAVGETLVVTSQRGGGSSIAECEFSALKKKGKECVSASRRFMGRRLCFPVSARLNLGAVEEGTDFGLPLHDGDHFSG